MLLYVYHSYGILTIVSDPANIRYEQSEFWSQWYAEKSNRIKSVNIFLSLINTGQFGMKTSESKESLRVVVTDKAVQHENFLKGHPSWYYSRSSTFNFGVLMGSEVLVLA